MNIKIDKLEFNTILDILSSYSKTFIGKEHIENLKPMQAKKDIEKALKQVTEGTILLYRKGNIPLEEIVNPVEHIKKLNSNMFLTTKQLLDLANILKIASNLKEYFFSTEIDMTEFTNLYDLFNNLYVNPEITKTIFNSILDENTVSDTASKELSIIRRNQKNKEHEIREKLNSYLHSKYVQESVITIRSGRFVIPVKNEYRGEIKGFIHDISSSGSTVFIEPIAVFDLNNDLNSLKNDENIEIEKILQKLSSMFFGIIPNLENDVNLIGLIDFIFAKAKYSNSLDLSEPTINEEKIINLISAWHPLIDKNIAVKNDIWVGEKYTSLIITGPNTGGKTVTLKTAGLLTIMALSGLHIPAKEGSSIFLADNVYADIGDEQSIQDSLSTFSSHITNISYILNNATENSFVLLDELGSGTDPVEGSSLAISILEELRKRKILTLSTTHYPEIKHFALVTEGFENASVEFNLDTLSPTYKLLLGVPGTSNAFAISKKLGISENIILRAKEFIDNNKINVEDLLTNIYKEKQEIELEKEKALENSKRIEELKNSLEFDFSKLEEKKKNILIDAKNEARDILLSAKEDANDIIKEIEKAQDTKEANKYRNKLNKKLDDLNSIDTGSHANYDTTSNKKQLSLEEIKPNMTVFAKKINQDVTVLSVSKEGKIAVQTSLGKMYFEIQELKESKNINKVQTKKDYSSRTDFKVKSVSAEINLLGATVDEACLTLDKYLDNSYLSRIK